MHPARAILSSALGLLLLVGLADFPGILTPTSASAQDVLHEVQAGDDLRLIAGYYYGDTRMWERIYQANREIIKNPNRIERGSYIWIPNPRPPAESYAEFVAQARKAAPAPAAPTKAEIQVPKLEAEAGAPTGAAPTTPPVAPPAKATAPPAKPPEPAKAAPAPPPVKAAAPAPPAKPDVAKAPQPPTTPSAPAPPAPTAPAKAEVAKAPPPSPAAAPPVKAPAPPAKKPLPPPPPPKEWYEELLSPDLFTSVEFLAGAGVLILGLVGLAVWRRRSAAQSEE
jgi:hypothetical protein